MAVTMPELLGKRDVIEDCRKHIKILNSDKYRVTAELVLTNGDRRIYRAKSINQDFAIREILTFVGAVEKATGGTVMWRLKGEKTYHLSTNYTLKPSILQRAKKAVLSYFFDIEE
ncbi:hypothetical protein C0966_17025 (plasmid) [Bacillus methanolicus]|uniref:DUF6018 family natural product bioysynthesis protein n=1 Tax=Bacillus methanolicus TaxID=1471 RepID=UPI00237FFC36|nr:DUF6018 family natural product bioysynthesis protein [Bacillus methanolicus]MDE3840970.1 hypothetical protein [Bacillus methanolicus]